MLSCSLTLLLSWSIALKFKSRGVLKLAVFLPDMLIFINMKLCNCQK